MTVSAQPDEACIDQAAAGAKLLTKRGAGMRLISVAANLVLVALVTPADLGLLAVVRGVAALAGDTSDLGFAWALLRRHEAPSQEEYRALAGIQLMLVATFLAVAIFLPGLFAVGGIALLPWRPWMIAVLTTMLAVPLGTGARIRIERQLDYRRIAFADLSGVLLFNLSLLAFAVAKSFAIGVFIATAGLVLYSNLLLWFWSPGPLPAFHLSAWRRLGSEFAGFTLGHAGSLLNANGTPILIGALFGLPIAGLWAFAIRVGNVLQLTFEGFRRAAIPAAGRLARSLPLLARLAQQTLEGAARLTVPAMAAACVALPVLGYFLPQWAPAVPLAQLYVIGFGLAGIVSASVVPASVAVDGPRIVLAEQFAPVVVGWSLLALLAVLHRHDIALVVLPMEGAAVLAVWLCAKPAVRPHWSPQVRTPVIALLAAGALVFAAEAVGASPWFGALAASIAFLRIVTAAVPSLAMTESKMQPAAGDR